MKFKLVIIISFIACSFITLHEKEVGELSFETDNKILWSSQRKLTWCDFKGKNDSIDDLSVAVTTFVILIERSYYNENGVPVFEIACYFLPEQSWTITNDTLALKHEQLHFDIGELYTRKIRKAFDSLNRKGIKNFEKYETTLNTLYRECEIINDKYDSEVYFNEQRQREWEETIQRELEELKEYDYIPEK